MYKLQIIDRFLNAKTRRGEKNTVHPRLATAHGHGVGFCPSRSYFMDEIDTKYTQSSWGKKMDPSNPAYIQYIPCQFFKSRAMLDLY